MGLKHEQADGAGVNAVLPEIARGGDVAEALRHLGAADVEELAVQPVAGKEIMAGVRAALGDLILVMGKDEIYSSGVDIQHVGVPMPVQEPEGHGRALEMPAGPPSAKWSIPGRTHLLVLRLDCLPECKVPGVLLGVLIAADPLAGAGLELAHVDSRQL